MDDLIDFSDIEVEVPFAAIRADSSDAAELNSLCSLYAELEAYRQFEEAYCATSVALLTCRPDGGQNGFRVTDEKGPPIYQVLEDVFHKNQCKSVAIIGFYPI